MGKWGGQGAADSDPPERMTGRWGSAKRLSPTSHTRWRFGDRHSLGLLLSVLGRCLVGGASADVSVAVASTDIPVEFDEGNRETGFGKIEDGVWTGKSFPPEFRAFATVNSDEGSVRFCEEVGLQGGNGEVVAELLDFIIAARGGAENFENHAWGFGEERVAGHRQADDHCIRIVEGLIARSKRHLKFEIAAGWKIGFSCQLVASEPHEVSGDALMIKCPPGHGVNIACHVFMTDFRGEFAPEIVFAGNAIVYDNQHHAATGSGKSTDVQASHRQQKFACGGHANCGDRNVATP